MSDDKPQGWDAMQQRLARQRKARRAPASVPRTAPRECAECGAYGRHETWCDKTK